MEVLRNGEWGALCDYRWDLNDAQVVCKELGFGNAIFATQGAFYERDGSAWLGNLQCVGTEWTIGNCSHSGWTRPYYGYCRNANVKCASGM